MRNLFISNTGNKATEYVKFFATEDCNLGHFVIVDNTYDAQGNPSNKLRHFYAFPNHPVKKDDMIVLWTRKGTNDVVTKNQTHKPQHNFFWNLNEHVWNVTGDEVHLLDVREVFAKKVGKYIG